MTLAPRSSIHFVAPLDMASGIMFPVGDLMVNFGWGRSYYWDELHITAELRQRPLPSDHLFKHIEEQLKGV